MNEYQNGPAGENSPAGNNENNVNNENGNNSGGYYPPGQPFTASGYGNNSQFVNNSYVPFGFTPETFAEKKDIRKTATFVCIPVIVIFAVTFFWSYIVLFISSMFGFSALQYNDIVQSPIFRQVLQIVLSTLCFTVPAIVSAKIMGSRISDLVPFEKTEKGTFLPYVLLGVSFCAFANTAVTIAGSYFEMFGVDYSVNYGTMPQGKWGVPIGIIATAVVPALVEEFTCRGILFGMLKKHGDVFALIVSSVTFGVLHGNFEQMPFAFLVGLALGFIRLKTGNLWACSLVHCFNNLISCIFTYFVNGLGTAESNAIYMFLLIIELLVGFLAVYLLRNDKNAFALEKSKSAATAKQKYLWYFTAPATIIFILVHLYESLLFFR